MIEERLRESFSFTENFRCSTPINLSIDDSYSVIFDFLEDLIPDHINFTPSTAVSLGETYISCITTTHSISLPCQSKYLSLLYCTFNPIVSTISYEASVKAPLDRISYEELCLVSKVSSKEELCPVSNLSIDDSCSVIFDFLEDLISDRFNFTPSTAVSLGETYISCITTTHSISLPCQSKYLSLLYCTHNPIVSTISYEASVKAPLDRISDEELCRVSKVSSKEELCPVSKVSSKYLKCQLTSNLHPNVKLLPLSRNMRSLLKHFSLSDFEAKYGLSSSILSKYSLDVDEWNPQTYEFYFPSCSIPHLPNFITVYLRDNTGQISEINETSNYYPDGTMPQTVTLILGNYKILQYLKLITLNFVNFIPLKIKFPPFVALNTYRKVVLHFNSDEDHFQMDCKNVLRVRLSSNGEFYKIE